MPERSRCGVLADIWVAMDMPAVWFCANAHKLTRHQVSRASAKVLFCVGFDWNKSMICSLVRSSTYPCASRTEGLLEGGWRYFFQETSKPFCAHRHSLHARCAQSITPHHNVDYPGSWLISCRPPLSRVSVSERGSVMLPVSRCAAKMNLSCVPWELRMALCLLGKLMRM
jgi:hypothetical protein